MIWTRIRAIDRRGLSFAARFLAFLLLLGAIFEGVPSLFQQLYMLPVAHVCAALLNLLGLEAALDTTGLTEGFCELLLGRIIYRVTFDCTGIFALVVFAALTLAFPATWRQRASGLALGVPAIFAFSVLRIGVLGIVAHVRPAWIALFHVYVMELATLGFMLFIWLYWLGQGRGG